MLTTSLGGRGHSSSRKFYSFRNPSLQQACACTIPMCLCTEDINEQQYFQATLFSSFCTSAHISLLWYCVWLQVWSTFTIPGPSVLRIVSAPQLQSVHFQSFFTKLRTSSHLGSSVTTDSDPEMLGDAALQLLLSQYMGWIHNQNNPPTFFYSSDVDIWLPAPQSVEVYISSA